MTNRRILDWLPDYDISDSGEVRRITPAITRGLVPYTINGNCWKGYRRVKLMLPSGQKAILLVHRLVCEAFHGPAPTPQHHAAHGDGDRQNNLARNLRWATALENVGHDRKRHGRNPEGERNGRAKLTREDVAAIRKSYSGKRGDINRLCEQYGIKRTAMRAVVNGSHWRD